MRGDKVRSCLDRRVGTGCVPTARVTRGTNRGGKLIHGVGTLELSAALDKACWMKPRVRASTIARSRLTSHEKAEKYS